MFRRRFKNKFNNRVTEMHGRKFHSFSEARRASELLEMQKMGLISTLEFQVKYELLEAFKDKSGKKHRAIEYIADFRYIDNKTGKTIVEDRKGYADKVYKIKYKMLLHRYPDINFIET